MTTFESVTSSFVFDGKVTRASHDGSVRWVDNCVMVRGPATTASRKSPLFPLVIWLMTVPLVSIVIVWSKYSMWIVLPSVIYYGVVGAWFLSCWLDYDSVFTEVCHRRREARRGINKCIQALDGGYITLAEFQRLALIHLQSGAKHILSKPDINPPKEEFSRCFSCYSRLFYSTISPIVLDCPELKHWTLAHFERVQQGLKTTLWNVHHDRYKYYEQWWCRSESLLTHLRTVRTHHLDLLTQVAGDTTQYLELRDRICEYFADHPLFKLASSASSSSSLTDKMEDFLGNVLRWWALEINNPAQDFHNPTVMFYFCRNCVSHIDLLSQQTDVSLPTITLDDIFHGWNPIIPNKPDVADILTHMKKAQAECAEDLIVVD